MQNPVIILSFLFVLFVSCRREHNTNSKCEDLKAALVASDAAKAEKAMNEYIADLPSRDYTEANINMLCQRISSGCGLTAQNPCFNCIKTLPPQSEIRISFDAGNSTQTKFIDLSYTSSNTIVFRNMHE